jgi:hypothetical protein
VAREAVEYVIAFTVFLSIYLSFSINIALALIYILLI